MSRRIAFPFLVLEDNTVRFDGWMLGEPNQPHQPAGDILEHWDYARELEVSVQVNPDWALASQALQLPADSLRLRLVLSCGTGVGRIPRRVDLLSEVVLDCASGATCVSAILDSSRLSGRIRLMLHLILEDPVDGGSPLSPQVRGARLWQTHQDILIEDGGDSRFPVEVASFSGIFRGETYEHAPWYFHWRPESIQGDFAGTARLYVNSDMADTLERFVAEDRQTLQVIMADVASQSLQAVLAREDAADHLADFEEGSMASQVRAWLDRAFPGQTIESVASLMKAHPGKFRAAILASTDVAEDEA